jgi:hypothetical protein
MVAELRGIVLRQLRTAIDELEQSWQAPAAPAVEKRRAAGGRRRRVDPIVEQLQAEAGETVVPAPTPEGRIVRVSIDGKLPVLALVVEEEPTPGFKSVRLQDGRSGKKFRKKVHRVLDSEVRGTASSEEIARGLSHFRKLHVNGEARAS